MNRTTEHPSVIRRLRDLVPQRPLRYTEALRLAERQADRFRAFLGIAQPALPSHAIADLPRVSVIRDASLTISGESGFAQWDDSRWIIAVNPREPANRQRFSTAHELFHIINYTTQQWVHPSDELMGPRTKAERLADYFAGCLLMPRQHVKRCIAQGDSAEAMARQFGVSLRAMTVRLSQLEPWTSRPRCLGVNRPVVRRSEDEVAA